MIDSKLTNNLAIREYVTIYDHKKNFNIDLSGYMAPLLILVMLLCYLKVFERILAFFGFIVYGVKNEDREDMIKEGHIILLIMNNKYKGMSKYELD